MSINLGKLDVSHIKSKKKQLVQDQRLKTQISKRQPAVVLTGVTCIFTRIRGTCSRCIAGTVDRQGKPLRSCSFSHLTPAKKQYSTITSDQCHLELSTPMHCSEAGMSI